MSAPGTALGEVTRWLDRSARRRVAAGIDAAFPSFPESRRRRLARLTFRYRGRARSLSRALVRRSTVEFCRALTLEGWEHLAAAEARGRGVVAVVIQLGLTLPAARALALYRSAVDATAESSVLPARVAMLAQGGTVTTELRPAAGEEARVRVPLFEGHYSLSALPARLAATAGAPLVPVFPLPEGEGLRLVAEEPLSSAGSEAEITRQLVARLEPRIGHRAECWPWMEGAP